MSSSDGEIHENRWFYDGISLALCADKAALAKTGMKADGGGASIRPNHLGHRSPLFVGSSSVFWCFLPLHSICDPLCSDIVLIVSKCL